MRRIFCLLMLLILLMNPQVVFGAMSSASYQIYADEIGVGGAWSTSTSYSLQDTVNLSPVGFTSSTNYEVRGGFQVMESGALSITINNTSLSLGSLSTDQVKSASAIITLTTDSITGYTFSISDVTGSSIAAVQDGAVSAGSEEYGLAVSGGDAVFSNDRAISVGLLLASTTTPVVGSQTTLTFKASVSVSSVEKSYGQSITITASSNI